MKKSISVPYTLSNQQADYQVPLVYEITNDGSLQTISCTIDMKSAIPAWLQMRKFEILARLTNGRYLTLYNERNDARNIDCSLFIDKAYADIMRKEKKLVLDGAVMS